MNRKKFLEKYSNKELADAFVFRNTATEKEKQQTMHDIADARAKLRVTENQKHSLRFKILQLKYQMEDCINKPFDNQYTFGYFLKSYVDILNIKRNQFAKEISINETHLSQIINKHREANEEILIRLELHSQNLINALTWYKLLEREKENELDTNLSIRENEKKYVKSTVELY